MDPLKPGIYRVIVTVSAGNSSISGSEEIFIAPSSTSVLKLISNISQIERELSRAYPLIRNDTLLEKIKEERRNIYEKMGDLIKLLIMRRDPREAVLLFYNISDSIDQLSGLISSIGGYEVFIWSALSPLDSSLKFPAEAQYLWVKLIPAFLMILILLIILFPLYTTDYGELSLYLADGSKDEVLEELGRRSSNVFETTEKEILSFEEGRSYMMLILASFLATVGLITNNLAVIIGSMLLSTLMSVVVAASMNLAVKDPGRSLFYRGIRNSLLGIMLIVLSSMLVALAGSFFVPLQPTPELIARSSPNLMDLIIAICAGAAGSLSVIYRSELGPLVGSAIAIALVPPAAAVGISLAMMSPSLLLGTISLLTVNILALIVTGYLSAKLYVLMPLFRSLPGWKENPILGIIHFSRAWVRAVMGIAGGRSLGDSLISVLRRICSIAVLPFTALILAVLMTTDFPALVSAAHSTLLNLISRAMPPLPRWIGTWAPLLLSLALTALFTALLISGIKGFREHRSYGSLAKALTSSFFLWLSLGYILGIHILSSIAAIFTISLAFLLLISIYKPLWRRKTVLSARLLIVLTLTVLLVNSASAFSELSARQKLYSSMELSRELISSYIGVLPEDVTVSLEGNSIKAVVKVDLMKLEGLKGISGLEKFIEDSLREAIGSDVRVSVELVAKPL